MGDFNVRFGIEAGYNDPEYKFIQLKVIGSADVSAEGRDGQPGDIEYVKDMISMSVMGQLTQLASENISYKALMPQTVRIRQTIADELKTNGVTLNTLSIMSINPTDKSRALIEQRDKMNELKAMSPEELAKKAEEARKQAEEYWKNLTPEQQQQAKENAEKEFQQFAAKNEAILASAKAASAGNYDMAKAMAAAAAPAAGAAPKFCPNCGTPSKGGKFCTNCGKPYAG
ncbi:MAG: hypothetical protein J6Z43_02340 [Clostridiales bacterium]|nr:hypothetical protein [Clostridiales bacterium]